MKDVVLTVVLTLGFISLIYIGFLVGIFFLVIAWATLGTTNSLFMGDLINSFLIFNIENPVVIYIVTGFSLIFIAYKIKHEKNKKRKKEQEIYSGSLIGKPLPNKKNKF